MIRHTVLLKVRNNVSESEISDVFAALKNLKSEIPGILSISTGSDNSPEGLQRGHTHGFTVDFDSAQSRDAYLPHPAHQKVGARIVAICEGGVSGITVVDWEM
jgi:Stress responsive A/B Barrel Domain